jgi:hypothetical protein
VRLAEQPFDEIFLRRLGQLKLRAGRSLISQPQGERSATRAGPGFDFLDFRQYVQGDDPRYVDWNAFARLDRLVVKQFQAEQGLCVHLLIDTSSSMGLGHPTKLEYALRAAAALGYVGLSGHDRVAMGFFDRTLRRATSPIRGQRQFIPLLKQMTGVMAGGTTDMETALTAYAVQSRSPGLAIIMSDLLDGGNGYQQGILALMKRGFAVRVLHLFAQNELYPRDRGNLRLVNVEDGQWMDITADEKVRRRQAYLTRLNDPLIPASA